MKQIFRTNARGASTALAAIGAMALAASLITQAADPFAFKADAQPIAVRDSQKQQDSDSDTATIRGRIQGFRRIVPGDRDRERATENVLASIRMQDGREVVIALGRKADLDRLGLRRFDHLVARGRAAIVEGVPVLQAEQIEVNGERIAIQTAGAKGDDSAIGESGEKRQQAEQRSEMQGGERSQNVPVMDASTRELLDKVRAAYREVKSLHLEGVFSTDVEVDNVIRKGTLTFTSGFQEPNRFRHETAEILIGSDGQEAFVFNKKANTFLKSSLQANRELHETLPGTAIALLHMRDPSLLGAMMHRPFERVLQAADRVEKIDDGFIDGRRYPQLVLRGVPEHGPISILIDPQTHLARRISVDQRRVLDEKSEETRARRARVVVDYVAIEKNPQFSQDHFAWQPGAGAKDVAQETRDDEKASEALVGKAAPQFELQTLDGEEVSLRDLQGKVVMLDFWAAWCPPCADSLPQLGRIYREQNRDKIAFYAIHVGEDREAIQAFLAAQNVRVPVLIDPDGAVAKAYQVRGVPKTVIIGMDGKILRAFTGLGGDRYHRIRDVLAQAAASPQASGSDAPNRADTAQQPGSQSPHATAPNDNRRESASGQGRPAGGEPASSRAAQVEAPKESQPPATVSPGSQDAPGAKRLSQPPVSESRLEVKQSPAGNQPEQ